MGGAPVSPSMASMAPMCGSTGMRVLLDVAGGRGDRRASAVDGGTVVQVGLRQDVPFLVVLQHVDPEFPVALLEQDVLRSHDVAGAEDLLITEPAPLHPGVLEPHARD